MQNGRYKIMAISKIGEMKLDELIATGRSPLHTNVVELAAGSGELKRGQLIGKSTDGAFAAMAEGATPYGILCEDVTLGAETVKAMVYVSGHFNGAQVIGYTADLYDDLRDKGIYVDTAISY